MRYIIGIDLGTTNCCVAYVDTHSPQQAIQPFRIPQLKEMGYVEAQATLPSFCYLTNPHEWPPGALSLPWKPHSDHFVGSFALSQGAKVPTRLVQSAKSWLCHASASRRDKILPCEAADVMQRISPVEAAARYLSHIKEAWNHVMAAGDPEADFQEQEIILTVPASFDEVARSLTAEAAQRAGFVPMTLLEEPQAAFYAWISHHEILWEKKLKSGDRILICDVGGGTTDFSLIEVTPKGDHLVFQRMAVGDHLLLGGDNMDATIAHYIESKLPGECTPQQWLQLRHQARAAKEALLSQKSESSFRVQIQGTGSSVIEGSLSLEITREEIQKFLETGFFGTYSWEEALKLRKGSGLRTMGLPYEEEPSILKHMAHFLHQAGGPSPDYVLFNGGAMKPATFRQAVLQALKTWFPEKYPEELTSNNLDLAVARGAAYYGKARRGEGVRIGGGAARGYYLAVDTKGEAQALTLLPRGSEEGSTYEPDQVFWVIPNAPVSFRLLSSHVRLQDPQGTLVAIDPEEMHSLPPIHTILRYGKGIISDASKEKIPVRLGIRLTPIGTLELWLKAQKSDHVWSLEFQLRNAEGQDNILVSQDKGRHDETFDSTLLLEPKQVITSLYSGEGTVKPSRVMEQLENLLQRTRKEWSPSLLRGLWEEVACQAPRRRASAELESRWWNLAGFLLRPGYGYPLDDFRMKEIWKVILADLKAHRPEEIQIQSWICYRRIAGGLNKGQQMQIANELLPTFQKQVSKRDGKIKGEQYSFIERMRALASLELLDNALKIKLGNALLTRLDNTSSAAELWAIGRLGARHLMHGSMAHVVPRDVCSQWVERLLTLTVPDPELLIFTLGQLARKTEHRELNLPSKLLDRVMAQFPTERLRALLYEDTHLTQKEQEQFYGENLPLGLSLESEMVYN